MSDIDLSREVVQAVRDAVDIVSIASEHTRLRPAGKRYQGLCPLHKEKTPSFSVDPDQGLFYCFGCGTGGDAIKLHMLLSGDDFPAAIESLAMRHGISVSRRENRAGRQGPDVEEALSAAQELFRMRLRTAPEPREYLKGRRISPDLSERYGLGYAPDAWHDLEQALAPRLGLDVLVAAGLVGLSQKSGKPYDRFRHRLTFPIHSPSGRLVGFGGRALGDDKAKYVNTAETERFHKGRLLYGLHTAKRTIRETGRAILVEGYFDVIGTVAAGLDGAVAGMGTALTGDQARLLSRFAEEVVIGYDGDDAGENAFRRCLPLLLAEGLGVRRARFGAGQDPDSLRLEHGPEAVREAVESAEDAVRSEIERLSPSEAARDPRLQSRAAGEIVDLLRTIPDAVLRFGYGRIAAQRLNLPVDLLAQRLGARQGEAPARVQTPRAPTDATSSELSILALLLSGEDPLPAPETLPPEDAFLDPACRNIYRSFRTLYAESPGERPSPRDVLSRAGDEAISVDTLAQAMIGGTFDSRVVGLPELLDRLRRRHRQQRLKQLAHEIARAHQEGNTARLERLLEEKTALARTLHSLS
jgi:DNA primase